VYFILKTNLRITNIQGFYRKNTEYMTYYFSKYLGNYCNGNVIEGPPFDIYTVVVFDGNYR